MFLQKSNKFWMVAIMVISLGAAAVVGFQQNFQLNDIRNQNVLPIEKTSIVLSTGEYIHVQTEVASKAIEKKIGLMNRPQMDEHHGMVFIMAPPTQVAKFWMKNTLIPLDIIFIDDKGLIAKIHHNAEPESLKTISSDVPVIAVLEINGGLAEKWGIQKGDEIRNPSIAKLQKKMRE